MNTVMEYRNVTPENWADLSRLFNERGGPHSCWCLKWRVPSSELKHIEPKEKETALKSRVREGEPVGILGYRDGDPVAWCSVAPRPTFRGLVHNRVTDQRIWAITCFFIKRAHRRRGITRGLIAAAVKHAAPRGAHTVAAYPVDPDSPSYRFMGLIPDFEAAGFRETGRAGKRRNIMRASLNALSR